MLRWQSAYLAGCAAVIVGCLFYLLCDFGHWPLLMFDPYLGLWVVESQAPASSFIIFPGMLLWGVFGAVTGAALVLVISSRLQNQPSPKHLRLAGAWALTSFIVSSSYFLWGTWPF